MRAEASRVRANTEQRAVQDGEVWTAVRLEPAYFEAIEHLAKQNHQTWREWVLEALAERDKNRSRVSWIRERVLLEFMNRDKSHAPE